MIYNRLTFLILGSILMSKAFAATSSLSEPQRLAQLELPQQRPVSIVLDTDTYNEIDDQFAVVYALLSPELDVQAIYAAPFFNERSSGAGDGMEKSYEELERILSRMDRKMDGFVHRGSTRFLQGDKVPERSAMTDDLIARARKHSPESPIYVVAVGAITNVANALLLEPSIAPNIVVVWLGGNAHHWADQREFNQKQDIVAARVIFDSGVAMVQLPCVPVVTHFAATIPELRAYVHGRGAIGDYLCAIVEDYNRVHAAGEQKGWSKVIWDMTAVAWLVNPKWLPSDLVHSPFLTDNTTYSFDSSRHFIRVVKHLDRDAIFRDFYAKLQRSAQP